MGKVGESPLAHQQNERGRVESVALLKEEPNRLKLQIKIIKKDWSNAYLMQSVNLFEQCRLLQQKKNQREMCDN